MKHLGIIRKFDHLGRIVVPAEIRNANGWYTGIPVEIIADSKGNVLIRTYGVSDEKEHVIKNLNEAVETGNLSEIDSAIKEAIRFIRTK